jgi:hypothetical protein
MEYNFFNNEKYKLFLIYFYLNFNNQLLPIIKKKKVHVYIKVDYFKKIG